MTELFSHFVSATLGSAKIERLSFRVRVVTCTWSTVQYSVATVVLRYGGGGGGGSLIIMVMTT